MIHKEGRKILFYLLLVLVLANLALIDVIQSSPEVYQVFMILSIILYILVLQFFRNPQIRVKINENHILAPADGKIVVVEKVYEDEYLKEERIQVSIFMSPFNVHVNRNPVTGIIEYFKYHPGKYLAAFNPKSSTENERTTIVYSTKGKKLLIRQIAGMVARRIKWYIKEGDKVNQGNEFGFIKFGSRIDLFLPIDATIKVGIGMPTKGGKTIIAEI